MYLQPYHYPIITFEVGLVVASFSSTTLLGFVSFLIYIIIVYKFKTIVKLFVVILRKFDLRRIVDANDIKIIEKLCPTSSYVAKV
jgi:energy-converting hydrogenase Eha subunit H